MRVMNRLTLSPSLYIEVRNLLFVFSRASIMNFFIRIKRIIIIIIREDRLREILIVVDKLPFSFQFTRL